MGDKEELAALRRMAELEAKAKGMPAAKSITPGMNPTDDMGAWQRGFAGAGKAFVDIGRSAAQLMGANNQSAIDESKALDKPLMDTRGGTVGNVAGNIAAALPASLVPGANGLVGGAALGAGLGALQPTGSDDSRAQNMAMGAAGGAAFPLAGGLLKTGKSIVEPLYKGGQESIIGRTLNRVAGDNAPSIQQRMASALELVPGSKPTAAEVAKSGGISAMQRAASAADPEAYATRAMQQSGARIDALRGIAGTEPKKDMATALRDYMSGGFYKMAREDGIDPAAAKIMQPQIDNLMQRMPAGVLEKAKELARIKGEALGSEGSVSGLHYVKKAIDDLISGAQSTGMGNQTKSALTQFKGDLMSTLEQLSPKYMEGNRNFATFSQPINQQNVGQYLLEKMQPALAEHGALGSETASAFAAALRNAESTVKKATGFSQPLEKVMTPTQMNTLNSVAEDLARKSNMQNLGRGAGSDTVQKLSMSNVGGQSGMPRLVDFASSLPGVSRATNWIYRDTDATIRQKMAEALLDPRKSAELMQSARGNPELAAALRKAQQYAIPIGAGTATQQ